MWSLKSSTLTFLKVPHFLSFPRLPSRMKIEDYRPLLLLLTRKRGWNELESVCETVNRLLLFLVFVCLVFLVAGLAGESLSNAKETLNFGSAENINGNSWWFNTRRRILWVYFFSWTMMMRLRIGYPYKSAWLAMTLERISPQVSNSKTSILNMRWFVDVVSSRIILRWR